MFHESVENIILAKFQDRNLYSCGVNKIEIFLLCQALDFSVQLRIYISYMPFFIYLKIFITLDKDFVRMFERHIRNSQNIERRFWCRFLRFR